jgi:hypothetical protein
MSTTGPKVTTVRAASLQRPTLRLDAKHYQEEFILAQARVRGCGLPTESVETMATAFVSGRTTLVTTGTPKGGAPYLRAHDALEIRPRSDRYLAKARTKNYDSYLLRPGMILTPSSGRNLGPLAYVGNALARFAMTDILRIVPRNDTTGLYLLAFLLTPTGQALIRRGRTGTSVDHLAPSDVLTIDVVMVQEPERKEMVLEMRKAEETLDEARLKLDALEAELHDRLALPVPPRRGKYFSAAGARVFGIKASKLAMRLDAACYDPTVTLCRRLVERSGGVRLDSLAALRMMGRYRRYYVASGRGRPILSGRQILQVRPVNLRHIADRSFDNPSEFMLKRGWTIFTCDGRAEQALGSPAYVTSRWNGWMASNHVMRAVPSDHIHPGYLYLALRSPYVQTQLKSRATGSVVDALDPTAIADVVVPLLERSHRNRLGERADSAWEAIFRALEIENSVAARLEQRIVSGYEQSAKPRPVGLPRGSHIARR